MPEANPPEQHRPNDRGLRPSRQQAILEAVADGVLVTDANDEINFINSSTKRILGLQAEMTVGQSLENFVGLFGKTTQTWTQTIRSWSEDPTSYHQGDTCAEQLTLENGHVVGVSHSRSNRLTCARWPRM